MIKVILYILIFSSCSNIKNETKKYDLQRDEEKKDSKKSKIENKEQKNEKLEDDKFSKVNNKKESLNQKIASEFLEETKEIAVSDDLENFILNYDNDKFRNYLKKYDINQLFISINQNFNGKTLLIIAVELQNLEIVKEILEQENLYINQQDVEGKDALRCAIEIAVSTGKIDIVKELLKRDDIFINYNYFKIDGVAERKNLLQALEEGYEKRERISLELYRLLENSNDEIQIEELIKKGANLNYRYRYSNNAHMLRDFSKLVKNIDKIKLLFKYGIGKEIFAYELTHILYSEKILQFNINLDYLKFIIEELKLNLNIKIREENSSSSYVITYLLWEICNKISQQKDKEIKKELFKYILISDFIELNQNDFKIFKNNFYETTSLALKIIQEEDFETILILLENNNLNMEKIFDIDRCGILHYIFNKKGNEREKLAVFESLFKRGLEQKYIEIESQFLENVKEKSPLALKVKEIIKKYYPNINFN